MLYARGGDPRFAVVEADMPRQKFNGDSWRDFRENGTQSDEDIASLCGRLYGPWDLKGVGFKRLKV